MSYLSPAPTAQLLLIDSQLRIVLNLEEERNMRILIIGAVVLFALSGAVLADVVMDQIGSDPADVTGGYASQQFEPDYSDYDCVTMDDFEVNAGQLHIVQVEAVFSGWMGFQSFDNITGWRVEIYSSTATASSDLVGDVASVALTPAQASLLTPYGTSSDALVTLPVSINLPAAGLYWVGVIGVMDFDTGGQIGVKESFFAGGFPMNSNAYLANPDGGFGSFDWEKDAAYRITTERPDGGAVPEPAGLALMAISALAVRRRR